MIKQLILWITISILVNCSVPQRFWPQKDITSEVIGNQQSRNQYLLASSKSEFKIELINEIKANFDTDSTFMDIIGIDGLENIDSKKYKKIIIIGTCLSWGLEYKVQEYLDRMTELDKVVLLSTSGDGNWLPKKYKKMELDALSSASKLDLVPSLADTIKKHIYD